MYACGSSSRRKIARCSLCSSFLRNYRAALSFLLRAAASPWFFSFYRFFLDPPDAVFALHDSRVQISWRKHAIPSRLALLTGVESAGRRHRRRKAIVAEPRASARGFCILSCAKPHRKYFRRGPRTLPHRKYFRRGPRFMPHRKYFRRGPLFDAVVFGNGGKRVF